MNDVPVAAAENLSTVVLISRILEFTSVNLLVNILSAVAQAAWERILERTNEGRLEAKAQHRPRPRSQAASQRLGSNGDRPADADRKIHRLQYPEHIKRYASANLTRSFNPWHESTLKLLLDMYILECCC